MSFYSLTFSRHLCKGEFSHETALPYRSALGLLMLLEPLTEFSKLLLNPQILLLWLYLRSTLFIFRILSNVFHSHDSFDLFVLMYLA